MPIDFYGKNQPYYEFSNFYPAYITIDGKSYPTSEHYFQSQKYAGINPEREEAIRVANGPKQAAEMGRDRQYPFRSDWESVKDDIMRQAVRAKFSQHQELKRVLLETGNEKLIEATSGDYYWGCGTNRTGKNMLGKILMEIRAELRT